MARFDRQDYLNDLVFFASLRVDFDTPGSPGAAEVGRLLADALLQPYERLIDDEHRPVSLRLVHQMRVAVEILLRYLEPLPVDTADAGRHYLQTAYQVLLLNLGTSFDELRLVRAAGDSDVEQARSDLADRLGFDRPERLDALFMRPGEITEEQLHDLFGLASTRRDPLDPLQTQPAVLKWRADRLRGRWKTELGPGQVDAARPIPVIDPDLISEDMVIDPDQVDPDGFIDSDIINASARPAALALWRARTQEVGRLAADVQTEIEAATASQPTLLSAYDRVIEAFVGPVDLEAVLRARTEGQPTTQPDEDEQLELLALQELRRLVRLRKLAASGTLTEAEWADATAILVQVNKRQRFVAWREEEQERGVFLSPDFFTLPARAAPEPLRPWRATRQARLAWEEALRARIQQLQTTIQVLQEAVDATENTALIQLRDALIGALAKHVGEPDSNRLADKLTSRLLFDFKNRDDRKTTRLDQGIETLQELLFSLRMGRAVDEDLPDDNPVAAWSLNIGPDFSEADFDQEWHWRGTYAMRRAAQRVLEHPENYLMPSLRDEGVVPQQRPTKAFVELVGQLRDRPQLKRGEARRLAGDYLRTWDEAILAEIEEKLAELTGSPAEPFELTEQLSGHGLVVRKRLTRALFDTQEITRTYTTDENEVIEIRDPHRVANWLQEIFHFVPMAVALQLQRSSEFLAALDWYQMVYAFSFAEPERKIYHGLELEGVFSDSPRISPDDWLREELNPHFFAREQKHSYTRFTILSIAQCLLDYADSEFTAETAESLPRARALYLTALDLADSPEVPTSNPLITALRHHAELNLEKLRSGRNIAGMERPHGTLAAETGDQANLPIIGSGGHLVLRPSPPLRPTAYRYAVLIQRSKELVGIAQQMEAAFLSALEKRALLQ